MARHAAMVICSDATSSSKVAVKAGRKRFRCPTGQMADPAIWPQPASSDLISPDQGEILRTRSALDRRNQIGHRATPTKSPSPLAQPGEGTALHPNARHSRWRSHLRAHLLPSPKAPAFPSGVGHPDELTLIGRDAKFQTSALAGTLKLPHLRRFLRRQEPMDWHRSARCR